MGGEGETWSPVQASRSARGTYAHLNYHPSQLPSIVRLSRLKWGMCWPSPCMKSSHLVEKTLLHHARLCSGSTGTLTGPGSELRHLVFGAFPCSAHGPMPLCL